MRIVRVAAEYSEKLNTIVPESVLALMSAPGCAALAAVEKKKGLGSVIFTYDEEYPDTIYIEWFVVNEAYRHMGIGTQLMENLLLVGKGFGASNICVRMRQDKLPEDMKSFFLDWEFNPDRNQSGELEFWIKDVYEIMSKKSASSNIKNKLIVKESTTCKADREISKYGKMAS